MPKLALIFHPEAIEDARAARDWYHDRGEAIAAAFLDALERAFDQVVEFPEAWPRFEEGTRRYILSRFPYSVIYALRTDGVQVLAVMHARREPGYWKTRR